LIGDGSAMRIRSVVTKKHPSKTCGLVNIRGCYKNYPKLSVRHHCFLITRTQRSGNSKIFYAFIIAWFQPITGISCPDYCERVQQQTLNRNLDTCPLTKFERSVQPVHTTHFY